MSILETGAVDGIALDDDGKLILMISDHLDWSNEYEHLMALQEKINAYIVFCEDAQYEKVYPDRQIRYAVFEINFEHEPTKNAVRFLNMVQDQVGELGIKITCYVS